MSNESTPLVALVTGAGQGIGRAIALRLADDGLEVAVNDLASHSANLDELVNEIQAKGRRAIPLIGDVSNEEDVKNIVEKTVAELGGLDVMVANAGITMGAISLTDVQVEAWDRVMAVNIRGTMLCYKYAAQQMIKQGRGGRIIGASSVLGKRGAAKTAAYSTTKFAIRGLTQSAATELAPHKITVNAYAPGLILTAMTSSEADKYFGGRHGAAVKHLMGRSPDGPEATPEVIASIVSYLVKPEAHFITGQSISVDGGVYMD